MSRYPYLLFDADNTLFCFDEANRYAFGKTCAHFGIPYSEELYLRYEAHNDAVWEMLTCGEATKEFIVLERFRRFFAEIGVSCSVEEANLAQTEALKECAFMMPHAVDVVRKLSETHRVFLVTNAIESVQKSRLARSEIAPLIEDAFISEVAGAVKPEVAYFDYVFAHIDGISKENCIVIGDSISSDIQGANNYGLPCCWFNPKHFARPDGVRIDYEITDLRELYEIV